MTNVYLACCGNSEVVAKSFGQWDWAARPLNVLVAFPFLRNWTEKGFDTPGVKTILDSGAYSAWKSGLKINFDQLCTEAANPRWDESIALDVIGDDKGSLKNSREMKARGLKIVPVFHFGDDWAILDAYKAEFGRIGLSCRFGEPIKDSWRWTEQCFARAYPARFHSFGYVERKYLMNFPFATADTASWHSSVRFGRTNAMKGIQTPRRSEAGTDVYDLRFEIEHYMALDRDLKSRWAKELAWILDPAEIERREGRASSAAPSAALSST